MKVLILASWYPNDEKPLNGIFFKEQAEALKRAGVDVTVLNISMPSIKSFLKEKTPSKLIIRNENGINVYRYNSYNFFPKLYYMYIRFYSYNLKKIIEKIQKNEGNIDIIHIHSAFDAGIAYSISKLNIPYVITEHSSRYHRNVINKTEEKMLYNVFRNAKRVIAVGKGLGEKINKYLDGNSIEIVPNMVSIRTDNIRRDKNKNRFRFFSLAFLNKYKGMDVLVEAFNRNKGIFDSVELFIGGAGPEREVIEKVIKKYNLDKNIYLLGELNRDEVAFYMNNSDAFVLASRVETFGIVFIEAMAHGKPVIGTKTGGPDTFINKLNGIAVEIDNVEELASAMKYIYQNYSQYDSNYIAKYCKETFSEDKITERLKKIYNEIIGETNVKRENI